jgi:hypothetical protein
MTDLGTFAVQSDRLRDHARLWGDRERDVHAANGTISPGVGQGDKFGVLAGSCGVSGYYDTWSRAMQRALEDAGSSFRYLEGALRSTANAYDGADGTAATDLSRLDGMI